MELKETISNIPSPIKAFNHIVEALMNNYTIKIIVETTNGNIRHEYKVTTEDFRVILDTDEITLDITCLKTTYIQNKLDKLNELGTYLINLSKVREIQIFK